MSERKKERKSKEKRKEKIHPLGSEVRKNK